MKELRKVHGVLLAAVALCGCASQGLQIRRLPSATPAADNAAAIEYTAALAAAVTAETEEGAKSVPAGVPAPITVADVPPMQTSDPWERLNRFIYRFNARFDEDLFLPVVDVYRRAPAPVRSGVSNFFLNLSEPKSVVNYLLQLRPVSGLRSLGRFAINSTIGIGGLFDVATRLKLKSDLTGFSATLSRWGMHPGPYLVIPILGPSTLRDGVGLLADYGVSYAINVADLYRGYQSWGLGTLDAVNLRASTDFRYYASGSPFEYETIRFLYVRKQLIEDAGLQSRIVISGELEIAEVQRWYQRLTIYAFTSRNEGFGLTLIEAMSAGSALVASRAGAAELVVEDGSTGVLTPPGDVDALVAALEPLMRDPAAAAAMGVRARQRVLKQFSLDAEADRIADVYRALV